MSELKWTTWHLYDNMIFLVHKRCNFHFLINHINLEMRQMFDQSLVDSWVAQYTHRPHPPLPPKKNREKQNGNKLGNESLFVLLPMRLNGIRNKLSYTVRKSLFENSLTVHRPVATDSRYPEIRDLFLPSQKPSESFRANYPPPTPRLPL